MKQIRTIYFFLILLQLFVSESAFSYIRPPLDDLVRTPDNSFGRLVYVKYGDSISDPSNPPVDHKGENAEYFQDYFYGIFGGLQSPRRDPDNKDLGPRNEQGRPITLCYANCVYGISTVKRFYFNEFCSSDPKNPYHTGKDPDTADETQKDCHGFAQLIAASLKIVDPFFLTGDNLKTTDLRIVRYMSTQGAIPRRIFNSSPYVDGPYNYTENMVFSPAIRYDNRGFHPFAMVINIPQGFKSVKVALEMKRDQTGWESTDLSNLLNDEKREIFYEMEQISCEMDLFDFNAYGGGGPLPLVNFLKTYYRSFLGVAREGDDIPIKYLGEGGTNDYGKVKNGVGSIKNLSKRVDLSRWRVDNTLITSTTPSYTKTTEVVEFSSDELLSTSNICSLSNLAPCDRYSYDPPDDRCIGLLVGFKDRQSNLRLRVKNVRFEYGRVADR